MRHRLRRSRRGMLVSSVPDAREEFQVCGFWGYPDISFHMLGKAVTRGSRPKADGCKCSLEKGAFTAVCRLCTPAAILHQQQPPPPPRRPRVREIVNESDRPMTRGVPMATVSLNGRPPLLIWEIAWVWRGAVVVVRELAWWWPSGRCTGSILHLGDPRGVC